MKHTSSSSLITAIDIGTTKICVLIAQPAPDNHLEIIGIGKAPSAGLARGVVVDIAPATHAIKTALKEAELMAGIKITSAYVGVSGSHINAYNSHGMIAIRRGEIDQSDITAVVNAAKAIPLPEGQQLLHALPQYFIIDKEHIVRDPLGMYGVRLEAHVHLITGSVTSVQNIIRCCMMAGITVQDVILEPLASATAVLSHDERELGAAILDIGGGTSDFAIYQKGNIRHTKIFLIAGNVFTNDIAVCLQTTINDAERIKKMYGIAARSLFTDNFNITLANTDGYQEHSVLHSDLLAVLEARSEELFHQIKFEINQHSLRHYMGTGLVLTGGGSLLPGLVEQASAQLHMPVRIGKPHDLQSFHSELESPLYATGCGILSYILYTRTNNLQQRLSGSMLQQVVSRMKNWVFDMF